ncbi:dioxygenase [Pseudonocardia yunnanensis]|uniref:Dioxygenase n=1 Tax=Pseudonocardia yunnanensis TaxID=58107 RepID=A0ABW4F773_9PSEU
MNADAASHDLVVATVSALQGQLRADAAQQNRERLLTECTVAALRENCLLRLTFPVVVNSFETAADPRLRQLMQGPVHHLHAYVREMRPTMAKWERAIAFLTETGQTCSNTRRNHDERAASQHWQAAPARLQGPDRPVDGGGRERRRGRPRPAPG